MAASATPPTTPPADDDSPCVLADASDDDLLQLLEEWFCRGSVTTAFSDAIRKTAERGAAFFPAGAFGAGEGVTADALVASTDAAASGDDPSAHVRQSLFVAYADWADQALDDFITKAATMFVNDAREDDSHADHESLMERVAMAVLAVVESDDWQEHTAIPYVAAALELPQFVRLVAETVAMEAFAGAVRDDDGGDASGAPTAA